MYVYTYIYRTVVEGGRSVVETQGLVGRCRWEVGLSSNVGGGSVVDCEGSI